MSLTSFLKHPEIRERFRQEFKKFKKPTVRFKKNLLAPPQTKRYQMIGMAFDYLLRFYIQRLNSKAIHRPWVAETGIKVLERTSQWEQFYEYDIDTGELATINNDALTIRNKKLLDKAYEVFEKAQMNYKRYLTSGWMTDKLISSAIHLGQLEAVYRSGGRPEAAEVIGIVYQKDINDLKKLMSLVRPEQFRSKKICLLNPDFGKASLLVGGADADLLIDETLIDIKVTKYAKVDREYFNQLIGYIVLSRLGRIGGIKPKPKISRIGIYFARYAHFEIFNLHQVINRKTFSGFVKWFESAARRQYP